MHSYEKNKRTKKPFGSIQPIVDRIGKAEVQAKE
jgi:hypothetical protein